MMDLSALQTFIEVMRQGSFAAVARERNLDPSSVSRAIAHLEAELGIRLFQRTTRQLSPTEAGTAYFERIEPLVTELQQAVQMAKDSGEQPRGILRVTASVSFGQHCIVPHLSEFQAKFPELSVHLLLTDAVVDLLAERIDVAVRLGLLPDSTLMAQRLMPTTYAVCASPQYLSQHGRPENPQQLVDHQCLLFPLAGFRSRWIFRDAQGVTSQIPVQGKTLISNAIALKQCALAGMGLALLPNWLLHPALQSGQLVNVFPTYEVTATDFNTAAWLVYPSRAYVPLNVRVWMEFLKQAVPHWIPAGSDEKD